MRMRQLTTRGLMVAIAAIALLFGFWAHLRRPYPLGVVIMDQEAFKGYSGPGLTTGPGRPTHLYQMWSDGWIVRVDKKHPAAGRPLKYGPLMMVRWPDGSASWYWPGPHSVQRDEKWWDGKRTWRLARGGGLGGGRITGPFTDEPAPERP